MNIFERAVRTKLRFPSIRGELTIEQLLDLPLLHRGGFSLDEVAKTISKSLKDLPEENFVRRAANPAREVLELQLEIVKQVIAEKEAAAESARKASERAAEREALTQILHRKEQAALENLTEDQIKVRLQELS